MKKAVQRAMNILMLIIVAYALMLPFFDLLSTGVGLLFAGLVFVLITNYIFFGRLTLWHKQDKEKLESKE